MRKVVSASRRTDLIRFHYPWLQSALLSGEVELGNPRFRSKSYRVDLRPESVHSLVLWSKDFSNVLREPGALGDYNLYFQYTINNYSTLLEPNVPEYRDTLKTLEGLLARHRPEEFTIRFDPVLFGEDVEILEGGRLGAFRLLCQDLDALGMNRCRLTTSYLLLYPQVRNRLMSAGIRLWQPAEEELLRFFGDMAEIAANHGLMLTSCASSMLEKVPGIHKGSCIDGELLAGLFGGNPSKARDTGQREACGCTKSADIGSYDLRCGFGCVYCYAMSGTEKG